jgi:hypothetical protein
VELNNTSAARALHEAAEERDVGLLVPAWVEVRGGVPRPGSPAQAACRHAGQGSRGRGRIQSAGVDESFVVGDPRRRSWTLPYVPAGRAELVRLSLVRGLVTALSRLTVVE